MARNKYKEIIDRSYQRARTRGLDYGFFLLRVIGIDYFDGDPVITLHQKLIDGTAKVSDVETCKDFWVLIVNLNRLSRDLSYAPFPLNTPLGVPDTTDYVAAAKSIVSRDLTELIEGAQSNKELLEFAKCVLDGYEGALRSFFSVNPRYIRDLQFTVTEFYLNNEGMGFKAHHPNGSSSTFMRTDTEATGMNLVPGDEVGYFVGMGDELKEEWLINGEPMYKAHLIGKYNQDGEWKPIVYAGDANIPQAAAFKFSENRDVRGIFFYMYATGFPVVEFVLRTKIELPEQRTEFDNGIRLVRVKTDRDELKNEHIYDGWLRFENLTETGILAALDTIRLTLEGLSFVYGVETTWQLKYKLHDSMSGVVTPTTGDMDEANRLLSAVDGSPDRDQLMAAISWFNLGSKSENPIVAFVCYYTAIEALARQIAEGKLDVSEFFKPKGSSLNNEEMLRDYNALYKSHYPKEIKKLLSKGYFDIHESLTRTVKSTFEAMYGVDHKVYDIMFNNKSGLVGLRGSIVHESYSEWDRSQFADAHRHLGKIHDIAQDFIFRVALRVPKGSRPPSLSGRFKHTIDASHPNAVLVVSTLKVLPNTSWEIRPEWLS